MLRTAGLALAATGAAVLSAPIALPAFIVAIGGYLTLAGGIIGAVSQIAVKGDE